MPSHYIYVYSPSDFTTAIPAENGSGNFGGTLPYTLTLKPGAKPTRVLVNDSNDQFQEVDTSQKLAETVTINGITRPAGTTINSAYDLYSTSSSLRVITVHFGGDGYFSGPVHGLVSTEPLVPGQSYTFNRTITSNASPINYSNLACFAEGTRILTDQGEVAVETLKAGQMLVTLDNGLQPLRRLLQTTVAADGHHAPVKVPAGRFGYRRDMWLSPQHRVLIRGPRAELLFGEAEVLVSAIHLVRSGLAVQTPQPEVTYFHLLLDRHEILFSEGVPTESYLPGIEDELIQVDGAAAMPRPGPYRATNSPRAARLCLPRLSGRSASGGLRTTPPSGTRGPSRLLRKGTGPFRAPEQGGGAFRCQTMRAPQTRGARPVSLPGRPAARLSSARHSIRPGSSSPGQPGCRSRTG